MYPFLHLEIHRIMTFKECLKFQMFEEVSRPHPPHYNTLAWKIPWREEPGRLQSMSSLRVGHDWGTSLSLFTFMHCRRKWLTHSGVLAWRSLGTGEPGGLPSVGSRRVGHDWSDSAAAAAVGLEWHPIAHNASPDDGEHLTVCSFAICISS